MFDSLRRRIAGRGPWPRRLLALACLALAAATALPARGRSAETRTVAVVVAAHALDAGHVLTSTDLRVRRFPVALAPDGVRTAPALLTGRRVAAPVARGEPLTTRRLLGPGLTHALAGRAVAIAVAVDAPRDLVRAGDLIDVVAGRTLLAEGVRVLAVLPSDAGDSAGAVTGDGDTIDIVVETDRTVAFRLAGSRGLSPFSVFVRAL